MSAVAENPTSLPSPADRPGADVVIYDGHCKFCTAGARKLACVVVYTPTPRPTAPCGACRQVIHEFGPQARVLSCCDGQDVVDTTIRALLPGAFGPADLGV